MSNLSSTLNIPDSLLAKEATEVLREYSSDLLFNHSVRVYLFAVEQAVSKSCGLTQNSSTSPQHFTISVYATSFLAKMHASRSMAQTPRVNSSAHITSLKSRYKLSGKPSPCTLHRASHNTCGRK